MKNSPSEITVAANDPRQSLRNSLDSSILTFQSRNRELAQLRKQLDLETEANDEAIRIANATMEALDQSLHQSSMKSLIENPES